jgi:hypothetical protein
MQFLKCQYNYTDAKTLSLIFVLHNDTSFKALTPLTEGDLNSLEIDPQLTITLCQNNVFTHLYLRFLDLALEVMTQWGNSNVNWTLNRLGIMYDTYVDWPITLKVPSVKWRV